MKPGYGLTVFCLLLFIFPMMVHADDYQIVWADTIDNGDWDGASCLAVDDGGNIVVAGCTFIDGDNDYLIVKYDAGGTVLWQDTLDNGGEDLAEAVAVDRSGNIIVTGYSMIGGDYDYFTVKYDPGGTVLWQDILDNGGSYDIARGVAVDDANRIVVTGYCDIGDDCVYYTVKYDSAGTVIWADTLDYGPFDSALDVAVDASNGIVVTGYTSTGANNDYFTVKYDAGGTVLWQDAIDIHEFDQAYGIAADNEKNILVTGCSGGPFDDYDLYTVKYDSSGTIVWTDTLDNGNSDDVAYDIAVDGSSNSYVTGYSLELAGDYDYFMVKYDPGGTILWQDMLDNGDHDMAYGIGVDDLGNVIVTGRSYLSGNYDFLTVKYGPVQGIAEKERTGNALHGITCHAYPDPFSSNVSIELEPEDERSGMDDISLQVFDASGRKVKEISLPAAHSLLAAGVTWDGTDDYGNLLPGGVYFLVYGTAYSRGTRKLLLVR